LGRFALNSGLGMGLALGFGLVWCVGFGFVTAQIASFFCQQDYRQDFFQTEYSNIDIDFTSLGKVLSFV
jgi:hypothetical protein